MSGNAVGKGRMTTVKVLLLDSISANTLTMMTMPLVSCTSTIQRLPEDAADDHVVPGSVRAARQVAQWAEQMKAEIAQQKAEEAEAKKKHSYKAQQKALPSFLREKRKRW